MKKTFLLLFIFITTLVTPKLFAQENNVTNATSFGKLQKPILVPSLAQQIIDGTFIGIDPNEEPKLGPPKRRGANKNIPGKGLPKGNDPLVQNQRSASQRTGKAPSLVFDANVSNYTPSDPTGAVGPNHFVGAWNTGFRIFDKDGNPLTDAANLSTLFPGNDKGDPIVIYDAEADRFIITEFDSNPNGFNVAICQGSDPVNDGWYIYTTGFETGTFPDYTKFSVWSDGYYVSANISNTNKIFVVEREEMLQGNDAQFVAFPLAGITTSGFYSPQFFNNISSDLPENGNASVVYMQDDAWSGVSNDHLKIWTVNVDWTDIESSTISDPQEIVTTPFTSVFDGGSFSNVSQPSGPDQDVLQATIMNQAQFRQFPTYNSAIFNFVVDTDGSDELAGIRWYELRQDNAGDPWTVYQEGTYVSPLNDKHAFSGSMVMDGQGNIGMGYTTVSETEKIAINYTGRYSSDALGQMTIEETQIAQSTSNNPSNRLADYVQLSIDPTNDKTFWHIAEYFVNNQRTDVVGVFQIASDFTNDVGVASINEPENGELSDVETVSITVFNYGEDEQSDIPVKFQVNDGTIVEEVLAGPLTSGTSIDYTFTATSDLGTAGETYQIKAFTDLATDEFNGNDTTVKNVTYFFPNDIGVSGISSPVSGESLTNDEEVVVTITNFGSAVQSNFDVTYNINDVIVTEQVEGPLEISTPIIYTFDQSGDLSDFGTYNISAFTSLTGDTDLTNDTTKVIVKNSMCQPESNCTGGDGIYLFKLGTIDNTTDCSTAGYGDFSELSTELANNSVNDLTITTQYGSQYIRVWIDFNDNNVFENEEVVVDNYQIAEGESGGVYTETMELTIPDGVNLGEHMMRAKSNWNAPVPDDACEETSYGETEDYMTNLVLFIGVENIPLANTDMIIKSYANNKFEVSLQTNEIDETLIINLHNVLGQKLVENRVNNIDGKYTYSLDLSYARPGAYIIRLGNSQYGKIKRIIVK
jgi:hypothetical protein